MKLTIVLLTAALFNVSAKGISQSITLSGKNMSIEKVFASVEEQTGYVFIYTDPILRSAKPVTTSVTNFPLEAFLADVFRFQPLEYTVKGKSIFISLKAVSASDNTLIAPPIDVHGKVVNEKGEPVSGVNVTAKGTKNTVITNEKGEFVINNVDESATLLITGINVETYEIKVRGKTDLATISVRIRVSKLDEIQVIAYGTNTQRYNVGSVTKVSKEDIEKQPVLNPLAALQGRVPGLVVTETSGLPGASVKIQIRGQNNLTTDLFATAPPIDNPLFIIDGVPFTPQNNNLNQYSSLAAPGNGSSFNNPYGGISPFNSINPNQIESIEVLRDADATAIYGSRGSNGVILITTKKGKAGKTSFNMNVYTGTSKIATKRELLNTPQYLQMRREAYANDNRTPSPLPGNANFAPDLLKFDSTKNTDWQKYFVGGTANITNINASLTGGTANTQFLVGAGYNHETYLLPGDFANKTGSANTNFSHQSTNKKLLLNLSANYSFNTNNSSASGNLLSAFTLPSNFPDLLDAQGNLVWQYNGVQLNGIRIASNPMAYLFKKYKINTRNLISNFLVQYTIVAGLTLKTSFGYNTLDVEEYSGNPSKSNNPTRNIPASASFGTKKMSTWIIEPQMEYVKNWGKGRLNVLVGSTFQHDNNSSTDIFGSGYTNDALLESILAAPEKSVADAFSEYRYNAIFGRVNYIQNNKYIVNLNGRRDGSSRFGPGKQFGNFGSAGVGWIFSEEGFFRKGLPSISYGKLRMSYGITGSDAIGDYQFIERWQPLPYTYEGSLGYSPQNLFNPDFSWASTKKLEVGLEVGLFHDRILSNITLYRNRTDNQLVLYPLATITGFNTVIQNQNYLVENRGLELQITSSNIKRKYFSWTTSFNLTIPRNKLVSFPGIEQSPYASRYIVGQPLGVRLGYHLLGVNDTTGLFQFQSADKTPTYDPVEASGGAMNDYVVIGNSDPQFYGGFRNTFNYKGFELDVFLEFRKQTGLGYLGQLYSLNIPGFQSNQPVDVLDRWSGIGQTSNFEMFTTQASTPAGRAARTYFINSDGAYSDASYIRVKNISISYNFPKKYLSKLKMDGCRVYVNIQNLFTITNYDGPDPETQSYYGIPPLRTISGGIQFNF